MIKFKRVLKNPRRLLLHVQWILEERGVFDRWEDDRFLKLVYWLRFGQKLNLNNPKTFNEKLQWLKLFDRKSKYSIMVDKYEVKKYIGKVIGEQYVIPTLGIWEKFEEIDFSSLPEKFVLKCTHDCGGLVICKNKVDLNIENTRIVMENSLDKNYYLHGREWPYKNVLPRIIAEQYMEDQIVSKEGLADYKVHCFNGKAKIILVCTERFSKEGLKEDFFDTEWKHLTLKRPDQPSSDKELRKPESLKEMILLAEKLAKNIPFLRVDFYVCSGQVYFGEITFYPASGFYQFEPESWDSKMGEWINLDIVR